MGIIEPAVAWESPISKCRRLNAGKVSFHTSSWALLAANAFSFLCESCLDQMTKAHYRDRFSAAAHVGLLQSHVPYNGGKTSSVTLPFLCELFSERLTKTHSFTLRIRELYKLTEEVGILSSTSLIALAYFIYSIH